MRDQARRESPFDGEPESTRREWLTLRLPDAGHQEDHARFALAERPWQGVAILQGGRLVYANPRFGQMLDRLVEALTALSWQELEALIHPADRALIRQGADDLLAGRPAPERYELRVLRADGAARWLEVHAMPIVYRGEAALLTTYIDIDERKRAQEALQRRNRDLDLLSRAALSLTATLQLEEVMERLVRAAAELTGARGGSVWLWDEERDGWLVCRAAHHAEVGDMLLGHALPPGVGLAGWVAPHRQSVYVADVHQDARPAGHALGEYRGGMNAHAVIAVPLQIGDRVLGVVEVVDGEFDDDSVAVAQTLASLAATAIGNAQLVESLRQSNLELQANNEELDAYAHTVAHDLKNPLGLIYGHAELLRELLGDDLVADVTTAESLRLSAQSISRHAMRMRNIINELLLLASVRRHENVERLPLDMSSIVREVCEQYDELIRERQASVVVAREWPAALGHAPWVAQVWANYLSNAVKYGGDPPRVELGATPEADGMVRFWVRDNGPGLSEEEQADLFAPSPLFTPRARGHGLGLSIVRRVVEKLGGSVRVESAPGAGSTFSFTLPASGPSPPAADADDDRIASSAS